ncbi:MULTISPECIES: sirohydrochlorin chelatase [Halomonadaceae]|uniref:sirohydrochlorin chelatase n=1 Tax=Halomonadaceae TaxID=28256 RepID=UPI00159A13E9|nr:MULTISPECIES: CbiX/SirB N-terminal domain-containing protein [Halomonas]QJQ95703.1 cobalamin biosynthesis protein CbiX [Halomonas sp. PA5]
MRSVFLVDNGSLRPESTLNLRRVAAALGERAGMPVEAASLLHSNKVPADALDGMPAATLGPAAARHAEAGSREVVILPFFFGPSRALTGYLPERMATLQERYPDLHVRVATPLVNLLGPVDLRLARILCDGVRERLVPGTRPRVALVDHGSPIPEVTAVRNVLVGQLSALLEGEVACVAGASMERREGDEYRFNEPLLDTLLDQPGFDQGEVIVSMLFLSPGRHAGTEGDVAAICSGAETRHPGLITTMTRLAGEHDGMLDILVERLHQALSGEGYLLDLPSSEPNLHVP